MMKNTEFSQISVVYGKGSPKTLWVFVYTKTYKMCEFPYYIFATTGQQVYLEFIKISIQSKHDTNKEKQAI